MPLQGLWRPRACLGRCDYKVIGIDFKKETQQCLPHLSEQSLWEAVYFCQKYCSHLNTNSSLGLAFQEFHHILPNCYRTWA